MNQFRRKFVLALKNVKAVYRDATFHLDGGGMRLVNSPPPVPPRVLVGVK